MDKVILAQEKLKSVTSLNAVVNECEIKKDVKSGKLLNIPIAIKDNISTKDVLTTASSNFLSDYKPVFNATVVDKVLDAGAVIIAKTAMDEFGMGGFSLSNFKGPVLNPLDLTKVSGGSSGGSAALVAAGVVDMAIGSDTGDSCRIPASYCGIVGLKPTYGRISRYGLIPYANSLDHVGLFANNVDNAAKLLEVMSGYDSKDLTSQQKEVLDYSNYIDVSNLKVGVIDNVVDSISNQKIVDDFNKLVSKINNIINVKFDQTLMRSLNILYKIISNSEALSNTNAYSGVAFGKREVGNNLDEVITNSRSKNFNPQVKSRLLIGGYCLDQNNIEDTFIKAKKVRRLFKDMVDKQFESVDLLIAPASGRVAIDVLDQSEVDVNSDENLIANNFMVMDNFTGNPSIVIPFTKVDNMPVGLYISSKSFNELELLSFAKLIEEIVGEL